MRQQLDLRALIEQCTGYLRDAGFKESSTIRFNSFLRNGLLAYAEKKGVGCYSADLGNEYLKFLKQSTNVTNESIISLFKFHSFATRGIVVNKRTYEKKNELDDFHSDIPIIDETDRKLPLSQIIEKANAFLIGNNYSAETITRYKRIWSILLYPYLKNLGYDYYTPKLGVLFLSAYETDSRNSSRVRKVIKIFDNLVTTDVCRKGNYGLYELASLAIYVTENDVDLLSIRNNTDKKMPLKEIFSACIEQLRFLGYSQDVIDRNTKIWNNGLLPFARKHNITEYFPSLGVAFLNVLRPFYDRNLNRLNRAVYILDCFLEHGSILYTKSQEPLNVVHNSHLWKYAELFFEHLKKEGRKEITILEYKKRLYCFIDYLSQNLIVDFESITDDVVLDFINGQDSKKHLVTTIKVFSLYLYHAGITSRDFGFCIRRDGFVSGEKLPSVYDSNEVSIIERSINQASSKGKRDYAMVLLMSRLGMRISDVCHLKFNDLDWENNKIHFVQFKTGNPLELPLLTDVGEAIINYLKYGRPKSNLPYIFLTAHSPYRVITRYSSNVRRIISNSKVNVGKRRQGTHSLRHSLASRMLANGVPLPIISASLGHCSTQTTMDYLRIDTKQLTKCLLDVPCVDTDFFMQRIGKEDDNE